MLGDHNGVGIRFRPWVIGLSKGRVMRTRLFISHDSPDRGLNYMQEIVNIPTARSLI